MDNAEKSTQLRLSCRCLRSKEMYYQSPGQEDDQFASGIYWCTQTHENFGPDSQPAGKTECCAGRSCYVC